jgi:hypothetical protein
MFKRILPILLALAAVFGWSAGAIAQEENDGAADVVYITPKPGMGQALEDAIREYHLWVAQHKGHWEYTWYAIDTGPRAGTYLARSGGHNWADFDVENDWDDEANEAFEADVLPLIESFDRKITEEMHEFAYWPEDFSGYTLFQIEHWYITSGSKPYTPRSPMPSMASITASWKPFQAAKVMK